MPDNPRFCDKHRLFFAQVTRKPQNHQFGDHGWRPRIRRLHFADAPDDSTIFVIGDLSSSPGGVRGVKEAWDVVFGAEVLGL